jgi:hypothetical protein
MSLFGWLFRRRAKRPDIPPYQPPPVIVREQAAPKDEGLIVEEHDTSAMTQTGVHRAWRKLTGRE